MSYDVLVIGGGPAGLSAALNVRARGRSVLVVTNPPEENPLWRAERVDNYLGMGAVSGAQMLSDMLAQAEAAGVEFLTGRALNEMCIRDSLQAARRLPRWPRVPQPRGCPHLRAHRLQGC